MFTTIQEGIAAIQKQILSDTPPEHALYILAQGKRTTYATEDAFDLHQAVSEFLKFMLPSSLVGESVRRTDEGLQKDSKDQKTLIVDNGRKVLLLLGDTGSGKSLFCQDLITRLWQNYKPGNPISLFISLARLQDPIDNAIEETLTNYGFTLEHIATLKKEQQFIFVLDGYDEIHQFKNLYVTNKLNEWNARTIITCRSQYLYYLSDTDKHFMPFHGEKRQPHLLQQFYVAPFSEKEIVAYVQQYEKLNGQTVAADLKDHKSDMKSAEAPKSVLYQQLVNIPGLQTLITTPFLLHLAVEALPDILAKYQRPHPASGHLLPEGEGSHLQKLTQAALYDVFIERWFKRQELKLKTSKHIDEKAADPKPNFWKFCKELAVTMRTQNVTLINYTPEKVSKLAPATVQAKLNPWKQFFNNDEETELLRSACPIRKLGPNQYGFIHASLIEYFATRMMYEEVIAQSSQQITINTVVVRNNKDSKQAVVITDQKSSPGQPTDLSPLPQSTLYQSSITKQNSMIQFLADRVQESEVFKKKLFEAIESSKKDERYAVGAANAITALNCAEINFNGLDFKGIRIPGANLSGSLCDNTNFSNADLSEVNFQGAWLREAKWGGATVSGLFFGELPSIKLEEEITACCYSPDGCLLAVAAGKKIRLFNAKTNYLLCIFEEDFKVKGVAWDSKSERIASWFNYDNSIRVFDVINRKELHVLKERTNKINCVAWDNNGSRLASGNEDGTVRVWEVSSGKELCVLQGHDYAVNSVAWDDKECIASGSEDQTVRIWHATRGKMLGKLKHLGCVTSIAWDAKSERLAAACNNDTVVIWDMDTGKELHTLTGHTNKVNSVVWEVTGKFIISGSDDKTIRLWDAGSGKELRVLQGHIKAVDCVTWNVKANWLASAADKTVRFWDINNKKELRMLQGHKDTVNSVALDNKGERIASGSDDETVRVWDVASGKELHRLQGSASELNIESMNFIARAFGDTELTAENWEKTVQKWEQISGKELRSKITILQNVRSVAWDGKGEHLASGSHDGVVRVWDVASGKELCKLKGQRSAGEVTNMTMVINNGVKSSINSIAWDSKGEHLASGSHDGTVRIWDVMSAKELRILKHTGYITSVAWDAKGERLATGSLDNTVRLWEVASGKELRVLQKQSYVAVSGKSNRLASIDTKNNTIVQIWDMVSDKEICLLQGGAHAVTRLAWDSNGERLAAGGCDNTVRIWDVVTGKILGHLQLPYHMTSCAWITTNFGQQFLAVAFSNQVACFTLSITKNTLQTQLKWLASSTATFFAGNLDITGLIGLTSDNYFLLQQHGAVGEPAAIVQIASSLATDSKSDAGYYSTKGSTFIDLKRYDEAIICYDAAIKLNSNNAVYHHKKAIALQNLKRYDEAIACYDVAIKLNSNNAAYHHNKAIALQNLKRYDEAIACYDVAIKLNSTDANCYYNKGCLLASLKRYDEAIICYEAALKLNPNNAAYHSSKSNTLDDLKRYDEALIGYEIALKLNPNDAACHRNKGIVYTKLKRYIEALVCYEAALKLNPNNAAYHFSKSNTLDDLKRYDEALLCCEDALKLDSNNVVYHSSKARMLDNLKRYDEAIICYEAAIKLNPNNATYHRSKGIAFANLKRYEEASICFEAAIKLNPNDSIYHYSKGVMLDKLKRYDEALICYEAATKLNPNNAAYCYNKGIAFTNLKRYGEALICYEAAVKFNPEKALYYHSQGWCLLFLNKYKEAEQALDASLKLNAKDENTLDSKAHLLYLQGRYTEALNYFDDALKVNPTLWLSHNGRANTLFQLHRYIDAVSAFEIASANFSADHFKAANLFGGIHSFYLLPTEGKQQAFDLSQLNVIKSTANAGMIAAHTAAKECANNLVDDSDSKAKDIKQQVVSSSLAQLTVQHSPIFSALVRDVQPSSTMTSVDVKSDAKQLPATTKINSNVVADKPKNNFNPMSG